MGDLISREAALRVMEECTIPGTEDSEYGPAFHATLVKAMWKVKNLPAVKESEWADEIKEEKKRSKWWK